MIKLRLALAARDDLRDIRVYGKSAFGAATALRYLDGLRSAFATLRDHPLIGAAEDDLGEGLRGFAYRSHRIYYRANGDGVLIVRILHHARDAMRALEREQ